MTLLSLIAFFLITGLSFSQNNQISQITTGISNRQDYVQNDNDTKPMMFTTQAKHSENLHLIAENFKFGYADESNNITQVSQVNLSRRIL